MTTVAFCPDCGLERPPEHRFCSGCGHDFRAEGISPQPAPAGAAAQARRAVELWDVVIILAGVALVVGPFLPFVNASAALVGSLTRSGVEMAGGEIFFVVICGVAIAFLGYQRTQGGVHASRWLPVLGAVSLVLGVWYYSQVSSSVDRANVQGQGYATASVGVGMWLVLAGAVAAIIGDILSNRAKRTRAAESEPTDAS